VTMKNTFNRWVLAGVLVSTCCVPTLSAQHFVQTNLTSDTGIGGTKKDPNLVNPWGMSRSSGSPWWISDNGSNLSTLYGSDGTAVSLVVSVPGGPSGTVFNGTAAFQLNGKPAVFVFCTEGGTILAWNGGTAATVVASKNGAVYKGLALANVNGVNYLYATDFHYGKVDVLDTNFHYVTSMATLHDRDSDDRAFAMEDLWHKGFAPFNIQNIGGTLYVTYAKQDGAKHDDVPGAGLGFVAAFTPTGRLLQTLEHGNWLNAPWALAEAPGDFGPFSHTLMVGNFGSGQIAAYDTVSGRFLGLFEDATGSPISIDGLWALSFGNNGKAGSATALYFTAGPNGESNGLFGTLTPTAADLAQGNGN